MNFRDEYGPPKKNIIKAAENVVNYFTSPYFISGMKICLKNELEFIDSQWHAWKKELTATADQSKNDIVKAAKGIIRYLRSIKGSTVMSYIQELKDSQDDQWLQWYDNFRSNAKVSKTKIKKTAENVANLFR